jgi:hypothetical protein
MSAPADARAAVLAALWAHHPEPMSLRTITTHLVGQGVAESYSHTGVAARALSGLLVDGLVRVRDPEPDIEQPGGWCLTLAGYVLLAKELIP